MSGALMLIHKLLGPAFQANPVGSLIRDCGNVDACAGRPWNRPLRA
ncbi:uncharacterized protein METZ01_LOCUS297619, partial [marine metagenome]